MSVNIMLCFFCVTSVVARAITIIVRGKTFTEEVSVLTDNAILGAYSGDFEVV